MRVRDEKHAPGARKNTESEIKGQIDKKLEDIHNSFTRSLHSAYHNHCSTPQKFSNVVPAQVYHPFFTHSDYI